MSHNPRIRLIAGLSTALALGTALPAAVQAAAPEIGSWGQAWGDDEVAPPAAAAPVARPAQPVPHAAPAVPFAVPPPRIAQPAAIPAPVQAAPVQAVTGRPAGDVGTWSDAWGDSDAPAAGTPSVARATPIQAPAPRVAPAPASPAGATVPTGDAPAGATAPTGDAEEPVALTADQIIHDRELGIVTANGRVEIVQRDRSLVADAVSYNLKQDIISASGNVTMMDPGGDVIFADHFELTGDFKDGVAKEIRMILADNSRLSAQGAQRIAGNRTDFDKAVYTACEPCSKHPDRRPLWEAKAERVTHNQAEKTIEYRDAWIELAGVPVIYTPYLAHPDPSVKRKTGFLVPTPSMSSNLGANVTVPYFWAIDEQQDVTFAPRFLFPKSSTTKVPEVENAERSLLQRVVLAGEHRWLGEKGEAKTVASLTADKNTADLRGHIDATGRFDLSNIWRTGYQIQRASDDTYNAIYGYPISSNRPFLTTRPYLEGFGRQNYAMMEGFAFQGLRQTDDPGGAPVVLPHAMFSHVGSPGSKGGYWSMDSDMLAYARSEGTDATRLSSQVAWNRPMQGRFGDMTNFTASLRGDAYHADQGSSGGSANTGRVVPQVAANWRFPFIRPSQSMPQVIEPLMMVAASPNGGNSRDIPNEDSLAFELDEINVLRANRGVGLDRVEGGVRGAYGLRWSGHPSRGGFVTAQAAQGWRAHTDSVYGRNSGFEDKLSDYVGRVDFSPNANIAFLNRVRLDKDSLEVRRNENTFSVGTPLLRSSITYMMFERVENDDINLARRQGLSFTLGSELTQYWSVLGSASYDLTENGGPLGWASRLTYSDECFAFVTNMRQLYTNDRDNMSGFELTFNIVFKTLGDVPFNVF